MIKLSLFKPYHKSMLLDFFSSLSLKTIKLFSTVGRDPKTLYHAIKVESSISDILLAFKGNKIVGIGKITYYENVAWILSLVVKEEERGKGIGSMILKELESLGKKRKSIKKLLLEVKKENIVGQLFFLKNGFKVTNTVSNINLIRMEKKIEV